MIAGISYGYPDHRVIVPDLRGTGISGRRGPYDMVTDLADLAASAQVLSALVTLAEADCRAAIRTIVSTGNVDLDETTVRARVDGIVAHCSHEAAVACLRALIVADVGESPRALGRRLWILHHPRNPWFSEELAERLPELLPEARLESVADGALSRPDFTAAVVRRITGKAG